MRWQFRADRSRKWLVRICRGLGKFNRLGYRLREHRMQKLDDEFLRRFIVVVKDDVVKDDLEVAGLGVNIAHGIAPVMSCHFGISPWIVAMSLEQNGNNVTSHAQEHERPAGGMARRLLPCNHSHGALAFVGLKHSDFNQIRHPRDGASGRHASFEPFGFEAPFNAPSLTPQPRSAIS
jgi:hypothetical protein